MNSSPRQFALQIVRRLQQAGYQAFWAGGCVRDHLLGREPKDYDVATNATPDEIRQVFRRYRLLSIGAQFGVMVVLEPRGAGRVEVATFRRDADYRDGRHPEGVTFCSSEEDAKRRDFTINGLFYDPIRDQVIDYVEGQQDLQNKIVRAIGDPVARFGEDKLRMLRAIRFAAHFQFTLESRTKRAITADSQTITVVSAERIAGEMRRILVDASRVTAIRLLRETGLLAAILPGAERFSSAAGQAAWDETLRVAAGLQRPCFPVALAALVRRILPPAGATEEAVRAICRKWRLANHETDLTCWLLAHEPTIRSARDVAWPRLQPILVSDQIQPLLQLADAVAAAVGTGRDEIDYCRAKLRLPRQQLDPRPLITGDDLIGHGIPPGPQYQRLLSMVRDAQLQQAISTRDQALALVDQLQQEAEQDNEREPPAPESGATANDSS